jgi:hypothetical protein
MDTAVPACVGVNEKTAKSLRMKRLSERQRKKKGSIDTIVTSLGLFECRQWNSIRLEEE